MDSAEYMNKAIALFKSGEATEKQWEELGYAILHESENGSTPMISASIIPEANQE